MAPAAESVTKLLVLLVLELPIKCSSSTSMSSIGNPLVNCRKLRVSDSDVGPMPSDTMNIMFRFPLGFPSGPHPPLLGFAWLAVLSC